MYTKEIPLTIAKALLVSLLYYVNNILEVPDTEKVSKAHSVSIVLRNWLHTFADISIGGLHRSNESMNSSLTTIILKVPNPNMQPKKEYPDRLYAKDRLVCLRLEMIRRRRNRVQR